MARKPTEPTLKIVEVTEIRMNRIRFHLLGTSPLICNRFQQKAWQEMLLPSKTQNRAALEARLKHDPYAEYRGSVYRNRDKKEKALFHLPSGAFHKAISAVAIDLPGAKRAQMERLTKVDDIQINLFGIPSIMCAMVRNSDMAHTPDVRTRAIFPEWAVEINVKYALGIITERSVNNLVGAAGLIIGIGDWRSQKGGNFGGFAVVPEDDEDWNRIVRTQGRAAQEKALETPAFYDSDTEELLHWFDAEVLRREMAGKMEVARPARRRKAPNGPEIQPGA